MLSKANLLALSKATPMPGISLFLPTQILGRETLQNPIILKNLLAQTRAKLEAFGLPSSRMDAILAPATALLEDFDFWQHQDHGLALYLSDEGMQAFHLPIKVEERAVVGRDFHILPLLPLQEQDAEFAILAMTADEVHAFRAGRFSITSLEIADMPESLESLDETPDYEGSLQSGGYGRPNTGGKNMPKTQVYGDSPNEWHKARLIEYVRRTAAALAAYLARQPAKVVIIADAEIAGHLMKVDALKPFVVGLIEANPASMDEAGLLNSALDVMQPVYETAQNAALEALEELLGRKDTKLCTEPVELLSAAHFGRVETLFLAEGASLAGRFDSKTALTTICEGSGETIRDLPNLAAQMTLQNGGIVRVFAPDRLPTDITMAAILRY
jgi:hypothetical protein